MSSVSEVVIHLNSTKRSRRRANGEGSVYWDTTKRKYVAAYVDVNGRRQRKSFANEDLAHEWRTAQKLARMKGEATYVRDPKTTLKVYLKDWLESRTHLAANTHRYYDHAIKHRINPFIGDVRIKDLHPKLLEEFLSKLILERNYQGGTILGVVRTLNKAFNDGVRWGEIPNNPMKRVIVPKVESLPSPRIPRQDVMKLWKEASKNPYDLARLEVGISPGLRPGEVAGLKWKDFDFKRGRVTIERQIQRVKGAGLVECLPKTLKKRPTLLHREEAMAVNALREKMYPEAKLKDIGEKYVFTNSVGRPIDRNFDRKWFRQLCKRAGVPQYQLYQLRKTAFTDLGAVTTLSTVKAYSGHKQISTLVNHYIDPDDKEIKIALNKRRALNKMSA